MTSLERKARKRRYNTILSLIIVIMMLVNVNLAFNIVKIHEDGIRADLLEALSFKKLTSAVIDYMSDHFSDHTYGLAATGIEYIKENVWLGPRLTRSRGTIQGPSGKETYYNLDMSGVVSIMRRMGYDYEYWVRDDGVKMFGDYVMVAANLSIRPRGSLIKTSLGMGIVCDTGTFAKRNPTQLDIATNW